MTAARRVSPLVTKLLDLSTEFDEAAIEYARFSGTHNDLLRDESRRAARQLRHIASLVDRGEYSQQSGVIWLKASWRVLTAIGRANLK